MAAAMIQTPYEAGRLFASSYSGKVARLCLAVNSGSLGINSNTAAWDAVERSGNGYARVEWTIPAGSYNSTTERYEAPPRVCQFTATGSALSWNSVYLVLGNSVDGVTTWNTGVSFLLTESPSITLSAGTSTAYNLTLYSDGFLLTA